MSDPADSPNAAAELRPRRKPPLVLVRVLDWIPWGKIAWEKMLIWGLFLLVVYALRHFFLIIFMTFILTYIMRGVVRRISRFVMPSGEHIWLDRGLSVAGFAVLLFGLFAGGSYLGPRLYKQGDALVRWVTNIEPQEFNNRFLTKTVGAVLFQRKFGSRTDPRYVEKFEEFESGQGARNAAYKDFPALVENLEKQFEAEEAERIRAGLKDKDKDRAFEAWYLAAKAPAIFEKDRDELIKAWEDYYRAIYQQAAELTGMPSLEEKKKEQGFEAYREQKVLERIFRDLEKKPKEAVEARAEWETHVVQGALDTLRGSAEHRKRFHVFYEKLRTEETSSLPSVGKPPYDYEKFVELKQAREKGEEAFAAALSEVVPKNEAERLEQAHLAFEAGEMKALLAQWLTGKYWSWAYSNFSEWLGSALKDIGVWLPGAIFSLMNNTAQLVLSLLLSFFITLDVPRLRRGILSLKQSRVSEFYDEIAPGLYNFGRLMGRAFQAQGVIAFFNAILTFTAIRLLGIENEVFLCGIVFVCSFIPVLGVVLSSVPIAIMAVVQPGGSLLLALYAIGAILLIHFIETSVLNPKILGDMLHLHPVMVLAVLAIGEHFFGVWGLLLAVPVTVFLIRCVILNEEIPGLIEQDPLGAMGGAGPLPRAGPPSQAKIVPPVLPSRTLPGPEPSITEAEKPLEVP